MADTLLIELLTEELPPKSLLKLAMALRDALFESLTQLGFAGAQSCACQHASPRRLAVMITEVAAMQPTRTVERKGPALASAFNAEGKPTPALAGFARSCGVDVAALDKAADAKGEYFVYRSEKAGEPLEAHLSGILAAALKKLPVAKLMRWGDSDVEFVRPVHGLVMLHGERVVPGSVLGLTSGNTTRGHRFMSSGEIVIPHADAYAETLREQGHVVASFEERRAAIRMGLESAAGAATPSMPDALLDEVSALVEWPVVLAGQFDPAFLAVPQECLILSMQAHQKYFPLLDAAGRLLPRFLLVSNLASRDPAVIVSGNERVLRARLSDARFFFEQDRKTPLSDRVEKLGAVVYHNKLGSQLERVTRIEHLALDIARRLHGNTSLAARAARLAKADLLTDMVGEFPELQGTMGMHYARHDGEDEHVARAIEQHYHPRFAGDSLPDETIARAVALADRLDALTGILGIGLAPSGDKDPFALRRAALGIVRILAECGLPLDVHELLDAACAGYAAGRIAPDTARTAFDFIQERLRGWLKDQGYGVAEVDAVLALRAGRIDQLLPRLAAVRAFAALPEAEALAAANKRIGNILRKSGGVASGEPDIALFAEAAERELFDSMNRIAPELDSALANADYAAALTRLAGARGAVDRYFDEVMVMAEEPLLRANRLALLTKLAGMMNRVADISRLSA
jgi:glycyl-tRNA synthetase beta chain